MLTKSESFSKSYYIHELILQDGRYLFPNDEGEMDRMDLQHHVWTLMLGGKLYLAPIPKDKVHRALDIGTGTGIWAIDFADDHPETVVIGVDLSGIQPTYAPPNLVCVSL